MLVCRESLVGWDQHGKEEAGEGWQQAQKHQPTIEHTVLCIAALLPSPSPALLLPGSAINPLAGSWGERGHRLFPTLYSAWSCFCMR